MAKIKIKPNRVINIPQETWNTLDKSMGAQNLLQKEQLLDDVDNRGYNRVYLRSGEGKLVPQEPTDEPAEKLLERIRAEIKKNSLDKPEKNVKIRTNKKKKELK